MQADTQAREFEQQTPQEAEILRDLMAALARVVDVNQTLEIFLINIRKLINYDRAGFFFLEGYYRYGLIEKINIGQEELHGISFEDHPVVVELNHTRCPVIVPDIQKDERFVGWSEMESIHGWIGAPLFIEGEMIGFLSLGSLQSEAFTLEDAKTVQVFMDQAMQVLERAWLHEQSHRRAEELEVLSSMTIALGQTESAETTFFAIVDQVSRLFGAVQGTIFFTDESGYYLVVRYSLKEDLIGLHHPHAEDLLWGIFQTNQTVIVDDVAEFRERHPQEIYQSLCAGLKSAVLIPLKTRGKTFGILSLGFEENRKFSDEDINLFNALSEIAGSSLQRVVVLESLEEQVNMRTQHLSTLYRINAITSEAVDLDELLNQVLYETLDAMQDQAGAIHLLNNEEDELILSAQRGLSDSMLKSTRTLDLKEQFWDKLVYSKNPVVISNISGSSFPDEIYEEHIANPYHAYIGTPIRTKGRSLGTLSIFTRSIEDYTVDDLTFLTTIADQVGLAIERTRLVKKAEQAAIMDERQRLSRELHDSVTQLLYSQVLFAGAGLREYEQNKLPLVERHLNSIDQTALQALKEMRLLVYELLPVDYLDQGFEIALRRRLESVEKRLGIEVDFSVEGKPDLDEEAEIELYRIAEEALNNTLKHANATRVFVSLHSSKGQVKLEVTDNGCGFSLEDRSSNGGMGLINMQQRAKFLHGSLRIITRPGWGTRIRVII